MFITNSYTENKKQKVKDLKYRRFTDAKDFFHATYSILLKHEAQNSLPLGNVVLGNNGGDSNGWRNTNNWYMSTVTDDDGGVLLVGLMTPPYNITLYETDNLANDNALDCLCKNIFEEKITVPGVTSENKLAERFAMAYSGLTDMVYRVHKNLRIYVLKHVDKTIPFIGTIRKAEKKDVCFLPYWHNGFNLDCALTSQSLDDALININRAIHQNSLFILEDNGMPVSMASTLREIVTGRCIGMVYTPPYFRNCGYASSCVAQVSQIVLDMGYQYVSLFTDLSNPVSNSIYQKIGYKPICDYNEVVFTVRK